jgi:hypothetical protein
MRFKMIPIKIYEITLLLKKKYVENYEENHMRCFGVYTNHRFFPAHVIFCQSENQIKEQSDSILPLL